MARKRFKTEQIIVLLREAEVRLGQGQAIGTTAGASTSRSRTTTAGGID
jgi:hypothetical protein